LAAHSNASSTSNAEIKQYFSEPIVGLDCNALNYWKETKKDFLFNF
jgi:hypothetical protein